MKWERDNYYIADDTTNIDIDIIYKTLSTTYWAEGRLKEIIEKSVENSVLLSLFKDNRQIGYSRIVSDNATFAWICDVFINPDFRGEGLGKWLVECTLEHPAAKVRLNILATRDAHGLYEKYGFELMECMMKREDC